MAKAPRIFHVNWFRRDENENIIWPGFGENLRVLEWVLDRCNNKVEAVKTPIGYIPNPKDIDMTGLDLPASSMEKLFSINKDNWIKELESQKEFFKIFGDDLPKELLDEWQALKNRLGKA
jgi:phosphoenolpyruvate carboxykinase (GTP)